MALLGLRTCIYQVPDIAAATAWYSQFLGISPYFDEPFYVGFNVGGYELGLHPSEAEAQNPKAESVNTYWGVEDVQANFDKLIALGATPHEHPTDVGSGIVVAMVKDPWQNLIGLIYNPHFSLA